MLCIAAYTFCLYMYSLRLTRARAAKLNRSLPLYCAFVDRTQLRPRGEREPWPWRFYGFRWQETVHFLVERGVVDERVRVDCEIQ